MKVFASFIYKLNSKHSTENSQSSVGDPFLKQTHAPVVEAAVHDNNVTRILTA